jgi:hypothetical protein
MSVRVRDTEGAHVPPGEVGEVCVRGDDPSPSAISASARFEVEMQPGWCWMQSRFLLCGFAMTAEGEHTRYAFLGGIRARNAQPVVRLLRSPGQLYAQVVTRRIEQRVDARSRA